MEADLERSLRLLAALEALVSEQEVNLSAPASFHERIQLRAGPLVTELCRIAENESLRAVLRGRVEKLLARRSAVEARLKVRASEMKARIAKISESGGTLKRFLPVYSSGSSPVARLAVTV